MLKCTQAEDTENQKTDPDQRERLQQVGYSLSDRARKELFFLALDLENLNSFVIRVSELA